MKKTRPPVLLLLILLSLSSCIISFPHDSPIEEAVEDIIEEEFGLDIDLSHSSKE